jgi:hypothetical protein
MNHVWVCGCCNKQFHGLPAALIGFNLHAHAIAAASLVVYHG